MLLTGLHARHAIAARQFRIGILSVDRWDSSVPWVMPIIDELARLGYVVGRNLTFVVRVCGADVARLNDLAADLAALRVDVILTEGGAISVLAAKRATSTIPIVMLGSRDPVGDGLVRSLAKPGGNVTGSADTGTELVVKRMQLLIEAIGARGPVGYVVYRHGPVRERERSTVAALDALARSRRVRLIVVTIPETSQSRESDFESAFTTLSGQGASGALVSDASTIGVEGERVADLMVRYRMPSIMEDPSYARSGVFMTYSEPTTDMAVRAANFLDRVLKGVKPADLPVAQATRFQLVVNLKTAQAMGISLPEAILLRADELIR